MSTELKRLGAGVIGDEEAKTLCEAPTDPATDTLVKSIRLTNLNDQEDATLSIVIVRPTNPTDTRHLLTAGTKLAPHFQIILDDELTLAPGYTIQATVTFPESNPGPDEVHFLVFGIAREV